MGRGRPIYNLRHAVCHRDLQDRLGRDEPKSVFPLYRMRTQALELRKRFSALPIPRIPMEAYHMCLTTSRQAFTIAQMSLSLSFGGHLWAFPHYLILSTDPPRRSHRRHDFRCRYI